MTIPEGGMTYSEAGVSINRGDDASQRAMALGRSTFQEGVTERFGAIFLDARFLSYRHPNLVAGADGVGAKLKIASMSGIHNTVGIDLVAMCVNDLLRRRAKPLLFLDYIAMSTLNPDTAEALLRGIVHGCRLAECSLVGGETAEMPDFYHPGEYDIAGVAVGVVEDGQEVTGEHIIEGDVILGLMSSGPHSNGYALMRKVLFPKYKLEDQLPALGDKRLVDVLLEPTRIYMSVLSLPEDLVIHGMAHITGGGLTGKVGKILPKGLCAVIHRDRWQPHAIFNLVQREGNVATDEMFRTFNMGFGMVAILPFREVQSAIDILVSQGESPVEIGTIVGGSEGVRYAD